MTAAVTAVDIQLGIGNTSTSGCEAADFAGFPAGNIALIQRGTCTFELKAENAAAAGAVGVLFFNQGNTAAPDRNGHPRGHARQRLHRRHPGAERDVRARARAVRRSPGLEMRLFANVSRDAGDDRQRDRRVHARRPDNVVMAGAHLDSVAEGPGINDNGSGLERRCSRSPSR